MRSICSLQCNTRGSIDAHNYIHMHRIVTSLKATCLSGRILRNVFTRRSRCQSYRCLSQASQTDVADVEQAEVVIVGGGVVGTGIAYHLAKAGMSRVVLLEKSELTAGSTWHAAGLTAYYNPGVNAKRLQYDSIQLFSTLKQETEQDIGFHLCGSIRLAKTPARVDEFRYQMQRQGWHSAPQRIISPEEIKELHPLMNTDHILAGLYNEGDGYVDPYSLTHALAIGARKYGARLVTNTGVNSMKQRQDGEWEIETTKGQIRAKKVLNAAGFWAREVGQMIGIDLPLVAVHHTYVVTSEIPEVAALTKEPPVLRDLEASCYARLERSGLLIGPYESEERMKLRDDWYDNGVPPGFGKELFEGDLDSLNDYLVQLMESLPVLKEASIKNVICGPITYAPDAVSIIGPYQGVDNYWTAVGISNGIISSAGLGQYLSEWIIKGEPPYDLLEMDHSRYGWWTDRTYVMAKARETYARNNFIIYPKDERPAGRITKRQSGLYATLQEQGAQFGFETGWEQPNWFALPGDDPSYLPSFYRTNWFEPVRREVTMVRENVGVIDLTPAGKFQIKGKDAEKLLDYIYCSKLPQTDDYKTSYMLTKQGKVYAENLVVCRGTNDYFCVTGPMSGLRDLRHIETVAHENKFDVDINDVSDDLGCIGLAGPKSRDVLSEVTNGESPKRNFTFIVNGCPVLAVNISLTGEPGWELYTETGNMTSLYNVLMQSGKAYHIGNFGSYAYNTLRIESGIPAWGSDMKLDYNVLESGLDDKIDENKECDFIGKTAIKDLRESPLTQQLVMLSLNTENVDPEGNETIWKGAEVIGHTTSGCYGYTVGKSLAFAYVEFKNSSPGSEVQVELLGQKFPALLLSAPPRAAQGRKHGQI